MVSRRSMLKAAGAFGVIGASGLSQTVSSTQGAANTSEAAPKVPPSDELLSQLESHETKISSDQMTIAIDMHRGVLTSLVRKSDPLHLNYLGSLRNTPARLNAESTWTGDLALTTWVLERDWKVDDSDPHTPFRSSGKWQTESTSRSGDIRKVKLTGNELQVEYRGVSSSDGGIKSVALRNSYSFDDSGALVWEFAIENTTGSVLEVGELGLPFCVNNDYTEFANINPQDVFHTSPADEYSVKTIIQQSLIHEQKVFAHHFVSGHSSYSLIQRPLGDAPFLLFHTLDDTPFECIYPEVANGHSRSVPEVLAIYSRATKDLRGWSHNQWINGHSSLVLEPAQVKKFKVRFTFIPSYDDIRKELVRANNLGIRNSAGDGASGRSAGNGSAGS